MRLLHSTADRRRPTSVKFVSSQALFSCHYTHVTPEFLSQCIRHAQKPPCGRYNVGTLVDIELGVAICGRAHNCSHRSTIYLAVPTHVKILTAGLCCMCSVSFCDIPCFAARVACRTGCWPLGNKFSKLCDPGCPETLNFFSPRIHFSLTAVIARP